MSMYRLYNEYRLQMTTESHEDKPIRYSAVVIQEDDIQIKVIDRFGNELILLKSEIKQSKWVADRSSEYDKKGDANE